MRAVKSSPWGRAAGLAAAVVVIASGCATVDRAYQGTTKVVNPDKMTVQTGAKWMSPMPPLREVPPEKMVVYVRYKNSSGSPLDDLYEPIKQAIEATGYRVTRNVEEANFTVLADVRFFGENRRKDGGGALLTGAAVGGVTGAVIGHNVGSGHSGVGAAGGAILGAAAANIMANRNKMVEYDIVVDLRVGERVNGGVRTVRKSSDMTAVTHTDTAGAEGGRARAESEDEQRIEVQEQFLYHQNRLVAHVTRMALTPEEALPHLQAKVVAGVGNLLP